MEVHSDFGGMSGSKRYFLLIIIWINLFFLQRFNYVFCTPVIVTAFLETVRTGTGLADDLQIAEIITRGYEVNFKANYFYTIYF